jgi:hypothetical protein
MRSTLLGSLFLLLAFGLVVNDASAGRFGMGGRGGFGSLRSNHAFIRSSSIKNASYKQSFKQNRPNRWRGTLTGILLGGLLASLFMGHGFGSALLSWLALGVGIYFLNNYFRRKRQDHLN